MQRFIHMLPGDVRLWIRFLSVHEKYFHRFVYDVHVGEGIAMDPSWPPNIIAAAEALTKKRIDVVGYAKDETWIFEVKPDAGLSALGQLLGYKALFLKEYPKTKKLILAIVTDILNPDEKYLFEKHDIRIYLV